MLLRWQPPDSVGKANAAHQHLERMEGHCVHQLLAGFVALFVIAVSNAALTCCTKGPGPYLAPLFRVVTGLGAEHAGIMTLGLLGFYWAGVIIYAFAVSSRARHQTRVLWVFRDELGLDASVDRQREVSDAAPRWVHIVFGLVCLAILLFVMSVVVRNSV